MESCQGELPWTSEEISGVGLEGGRPRWGPADKGTSDRGVSGKVMVTGMATRTGTKKATGDGLEQELDGHESF